MTTTRTVGLALLVFATVACSDDKAAEPAESTMSTASSAPPTICATTPPPEGRVVTVTIDDVVGGFGRLGLRANSGLTPGVIRLDVVGDPENAGPFGVSILRDGIQVATVDGVDPGETCGIDLEVSEGVYQVIEGERDVEFTVEP